MENPSLFSEMKVIKFLRIYHAFLSNPSSYLLLIPVSQIFHWRHKGKRRGSTEDAITAGTLGKRMTQSRTHRRTGGVVAVVVLQLTAEILWEFFLLLELQSVRWAGDLSWISNVAYCTRLFIFLEPAKERLKARRRCWWIWSLRWTQSIPWLQLRLFRIYKRIAVGLVMTHIPIPRGIIVLIVVASIMSILSNKVFTNHASWTVGGGEILQDGNKIARSETLIFLMSTGWKMF